MLISAETQKMTEIRAKRFLNETWFKNDINKLLLQAVEETIHQ